MGSQCKYVKLLGSLGPAKLTYGTLHQYKLTYSKSPLAYVDYHSSDLYGIVWMVVCLKASILLVESDLGRIWRTLSQEC